MSDSNDVQGSTAKRIRVYVTIYPPITSDPVLEAMIVRALRKHQQDSSST